MMAITRGMGYLDYYQYQATARGIHGLSDVIDAIHGRVHVWTRIVLPWLSADRGEPIAELACGHGSFLWWLKDCGFTQVTGVDSSPEQMEFARQVGVETHLQDALEWLREQPNASQRTLTAIDFLEHISKDDVMELLAQSRRVLQPGGRLILRYPNGDSPLVGMNLFNDITHVWTYTPNCLDTLARMHGFVKTEFVDESELAIRDHRWFKVPLCRLSKALLSVLFRAATKEKVVFWSPNLWALLER
jgi:SAM-dependent methyltransferase